MRGARGRFEADSKDARTFLSARVRGGLSARARGGFLLALTLTVLFGHLVFHDSLSGDASVYFCFFKRFFERPFSFQPGTVSHGAASPLHVLLGAAAHRLWPGAWLEAMRVLASLAIAGGLACVRGTLPAGRRYDVSLLALGLWMHGLWIASAQLFETSHAFLLVAALYHALRTGRDRRAAWLAGGLVLVRPELGLVGVLAGLEVGRRLGWSRRFWLATILSWSPFALWAVYMHAQTGEWIPSNVLARGLESRAGDASWPTKVVHSLLALVRHGPWMAFGLAVLAWRALRRDPRVGRAEWIVAGPLIAIYLLRPPGGFLLRYWLPILPVLLYAAVSCVEDWMASPRGTGRRTSGRTLLAAGSIVAALLVPPRIAGRDLDTRLLRDLGRVLDEVAGPDDRVLAYEIQGQYWTERFCVSADGIVGRQMHDALRGRRSFAETLVDEDIDFVVTMNSLSYRPIFAGTVLAALYEHDLASEVGARIELEGLRFEKVRTNPVFARSELHQVAPWKGLNRGSTLRLYPPEHEAWAGHHPLWNSVYRVEPVGGARRTDRGAQ